MGLSKIGRELDRCLDCKICVWTDKSCRQNAWWVHQICVWNRWTGKKLKRIWWKNYDCVNAPLTSYIQNCYEDIKVFIFYVIFFSIKIEAIGSQFISRWQIYYKYVCRI